MAPLQYRHADIYTTGIPFVKLGKLGAMARSVLRTPFGQRVKDAREAVGMSQVALATAIGVSQSVIAEAETKSTSSAYTVRLALALKVLPLWLETGEGPRHPKTPEEHWGPMLTAFNSLDPDRQKTVLMVAEAMALPVPPGLSTAIPPAVYGPRPDDPPSER